MPQFIDLTGERFGRWTVIERAPNFGTSTAWWCRCDCGKVSAIRSNTLKNGKSTSCGCRRDEVAAEKETKHGMYQTRLYTVWSNMKGRCLRPSHPNYPNYGGRGIKICDEWMNDFQAFHDWAMASGYDPDAPRNSCTLDRIDNDLGYFPENCRWVSNKIQSNNKRSNRVYLFRGEAHTIAEWAEIVGVTHSRLRHLLDRGKSFEDAMTIITQITEVE